MVDLAFGKSLPFRETLCSSSDPGCGVLIGTAFIIILAVLGLLLISLRGESEDVKSPDKTRLCDCSVVICVAILWRQKIAVQNLQCAPPTLVASTLSEPCAAVSSVVI